MEEAGREWRIGELARATHVTVRALHHYERLGLLVPSSRTAGGHRCYTGDDVRRLHSILALRSFGLSLREIGLALDRDGDDPRPIVRRQLAETEERLRKAMRLRARLLTVLGGLDRLPEPSTAQFVALIEEMMAFDQPLTPEQLRKMTRQRDEWASSLSAEEIAELSRKRSEAMAALSAEDLAEMHQTRSRLMPQED